MVFMSKIFRCPSRPGILLEVSKATGKKNGVVYLSLTSLQPSAKKIGSENVFSCRCSVKTEGKTSITLSY